MLLRLWSSLVIILYSFEKLVGFPIIVFALTIIWAHSKGLYSSEEKEDGARGPRVLELFKGSNKKEYLTESLDFPVKWRIEPVDQELVWKLRYTEKLKIKEIAKRVNRKPDTIQHILWKMRKSRTAKKE